MRYVFLAIIVFLIGLGLLLYGGIGYYFVKNYQLKEGPEVLGVKVPSIERSVEREFDGVVSKRTEKSFILKDKTGKLLSIAFSDKTKFIGGKNTDLKGKIKVSGIGRMKKGIISATEIKIATTVVKSPSITPKSE